MRFLSLFSGIEAASHAWHKLGWQCAGFAEIDTFPKKVLAYRYPDVPNLGDVTKITEAQIAALGHIDVLIFGSPCQDLSLAGKRKGLSGERSGLFHDAMRIVGYARQHCGLRFALWENVFGAFSSNAGEDFAVVVGTMAGITNVATLVPAEGRDKNGNIRWGNEGAIVGTEAMVEWSTLDAQWFGVAQRRRRVFALADFGDWSNRPPILLERESLRGDSPPSRKARETTAGTLTRGTHSGSACGADDRDGLLQPVVGALTASCGPNSHGFTDFTSNTSVDQGRLISVEDVAQCLTTGTGKRYDPFTETLIAFNHNAQPDQMTFDPHVSASLTCSQGPAIAYMPARTFASDGGIDEFFAPRDVCDSLHTASGSGNKAPLIAFSAKDYGADATVDLAPTLRAMGHSGSHANAGGQLAICATGEIAHTLRAEGFDASEDGTGRGVPTVAVVNMQVRRLTPRECERLQGFEDDWTLIPGAKDGPRYKALGNSMATPVILWIGRSIERATHPFWQDYRAGAEQ